MDKHIIKNISRIHQGSNGKIYKCMFNDKSAILKIYKCKNQIIKSDMINDINIIRNKVSRFINIPKIYYWSITQNNLTIVEEFCGNNLMSKINDNWSNKTVNKIKLIIDLISKLPQDIPLDTNPYNFTIHNNKIYFVDFMPPNPWKYENDDKLNEEYRKIFRSINNAYTRKITRSKRYYITKYRILKYFYYFDFIQSTPQEH